MPVTVCILGAGDIGGAVAHALARSANVGRVLFIDRAGAAAAGKALDIQQSGAIEGFQTRLEGTDDFTRAAGCAVCIVADRFGPSGGEWQGEDGLAMLTRLSPFAGDAPLVFAGASQSDLLLGAAREAGFARQRLIGSGPEALASAVVAIVAMEARCAPDEVNLTVLGAPPAGFLVPWSEASIGGYALERTLSTVQMARISARAARLWPPGPFALGAAAARVTDGILRSSRRAHSVLTVLRGELGVRDRVGAIPALLSTTGIVHVRTPTLSPKERVQLETTLGA